MFPALEDIETEKLVAELVRRNEFPTVSIVWGRWGSMPERLVRVCLTREIAEQVKASSLVGPNAYREMRVTEHLVQDTLTEANDVQEDG